MSYESAVLADNPSIYLPMNDAAGATRLRFYGTEATKAVIERGTPTMNGDSWGFPGTYAGATRVKFSDSSAGSAGFPATEFWVRVNPGTTGTILYQYDRWDTTVSSSGALSFSVGTGGRLMIRTVNAPAESPVINDGQWHHVAAVYISGNIVQVNIDGVAYSMTQAHSGSGYFPYYMYGGNNSGASRFTGELRGFAMYRTGMTGDQLLQHYRASQDTGGPWFLFIEGSEVPLTLEGAYVDGALTAVADEPSVA